MPDAKVGADRSTINTESSKYSRGKTVLAICRVSNLPTVWMNVLTAAWLSGMDVSLSSLSLLFISLSCFYCGGMCLNDVFDRGFDADHQSFRPIPAEQISVTEASWWCVALFVMALGLLLLTPYPGSVLPGLLLLALIVTYDRFHKRFTGSVLLMAGTRMMVFVVTAWALSSQVGGLVWIGAAAQFGYTLLVAAVARFEHTRGEPYSFPVIPRMIAGMSLLDGVVLAILVGPLGLVFGGAAACLTHAGQRWVRGD
jgi:4-hydroxybenzoate polyprenyltransferase